MAAGEMASGLVQWLRLPTSERYPADGLNAAVVKKLNELISAPNENFSIGATLAARLGLERVFAIDDHTSDSVISEDEAYNNALRQHWAVPSATLQPLKSLPWQTPDEEMVRYRLLNRPDMLRATIDHDFGASLRDESRERWLRQYVAWWEVRNLRMVANIRASFAQHPGAKVLVIVGSSHKPYFEDYLNQMPDVDIVDVQKILR
jgi:hypothetical protein